LYKNLPIRWVRAVGVVVAIDDYEGRRILTVDDSTGVSVECKIEAKKRAEDSNVVPVATRWDQPPPPPPEYGDFDVGHVVEVKGGLCTFRGDNQIKVETVRHVWSTAEEVILWGKRTSFRQQILDPPWILSKAQIRKCKEDAEVSAGAELAIIQGKRKLKTAPTSNGVDLDAYKIRKRRPNPGREGINEAVRKQKPVLEIDPYQIRKRTSKGAWAMEPPRIDLELVDTATVETGNSVPPEPNPFRIRRETPNASIGTAAKSPSAHWAALESSSVNGIQPEQNSDSNIPSGQDPYRIRRRTRSHTTETNSSHGDNLLMEELNSKATVDPFTVRKQKPKVPAWIADDPEPPQQEHRQIRDDPYRIRKRASQIPPWAIE